MKEFYQNPRFGSINWDLEAVNDRVSGEWASLNEIKGRKNKVKYILNRMNLSKLISIYSKIRK